MELKKRGLAYRRFFNRDSEWPCLCCAGAGWGIGAPGGKLAPCLVSLCSLWSIPPNSPSAETSAPASHADLLPKSNQPSPPEKHPMPYAPVLRQIPAPARHQASTPKTTSPPPREFRLTPPQHYGRTSEIAPNARSTNTASSPQPSSHAIPPSAPPTPSDAPQQFSLSTHS